MAGKPGKKDKKAMDGLAGVTSAVAAQIKRHPQSKYLPLNGSIRLSFPLHYWHYHCNNMQTLITEFNLSPQLLMTLGRDFKGRYKGRVKPL